jgi:putative component of membrane protein insertase Oxa1/YidC/SpoIIIJ protein YidD
MKYFGFVIFLLIAQISLSQTDSTSAEIFEIATESFDHQEDSVRRLMKPGKANFWGYVNPVHYLSVGFMTFYQRSITHQLHGSCAYHHSCSQYTKYCVEHKGLFLGVLLGFYQLQSCFPGARRDYPSYLVDDEGRIINTQNTYE